MSLVVGLDTASTRWHAVASDGFSNGVDLQPSRKPWKDKSPDERRAELRRTFGETLDALIFVNGHGFAIYCEEPLALQNGKTTRLLSLAAGALWAEADRRGIEWHWVDVAHWKRVVVGNGNADKAKIQAHAEEAYGVEYPAEDYYDAHCIMVYGRDFSDATTLHA